MAEEVSHRDRVDRLFRRDTRLALTFVVLLWATIIYVYLAVATLIEDGSIQLVLGIAAALVITFNTASIVAMLRHYTHDKEEIYGLDIRHQDAFTELKRSRRVQDREVPA